MLTAGLCKKKTINKNIRNTDLIIFFSVSWKLLELKENKTFKIR